ncbi:24389_t:CDS:2 [Entrophospora sp. SA101]|nr:24389_t:CDS:2 [Entrophospora sp. SA101]
MLTSQRLVKEALNVIKNFNKENPNMITGKRLLFEVLYEFKKNEKEWVSAGIIYHKLDPVSPPNKILYPLINYYQSIINKTKVSKKSLADAHYNILELLLTRIEYGDNKIRYVKDAIKSFVWLETILETNLYNVLATLFGFIAFCTEKLIYQIKKAILNHDDNALENLLEVGKSQNEESSDIDDKSHIEIIEDDKFDNDDNDIEKLPDIGQSRNEIIKIEEGGLDNDGDTPTTNFTIGDCPSLDVVNIALESNQASANFNLICCNNGNLIL